MLDETPAAGKKYNNLVSANYTKGATISSKPSVNKTPSEREKLHDLTKKRQKVVRLITGVGLVCALSGFVIWQMIFNVQVRVIGTTNQPSADQLKTYQQSINRYLDTQPMERLKLALNQSNLLLAIAHESPEVASINTIKTAFLQPSEFELTMRQPIVAWKIDNQTQFVDADGVAFGTNYFTDPALKIQDHSRISSTTDVSLASGRFLRFVGQFVSLSKDKGYQVSAVIIPKTSLREINIQLKDQPMLIKASIIRSAAEQVEDMARSLAYFKQTGAKPTYVDVRVARKAYYK